MQLLPHQELAVEFAINTKSILLAMEAGTGKTAIAIELMRLDTERYGRKHVVIAPAYLLLNWRAELEKWWPSATVTIEGYKGKPAEPTATVMLASYEKSRKLDGYIRLRRSVVWDEAHYLSGDSDRSEFARDVSKDYLLHRAVLMTGTPMQNRIPDLYNLFWILDAVEDRGFRKAFGRKNRFSDTFCLWSELKLPRMAFPVKRYYGSKNLDYLKPWLKCWWLKAKLDDVITLKGVTEEEVMLHEIDSKLEKLLSEAWELQENGVMPQEDHEYGDAVGEHISTAKSNTAVAKCQQTAEFVKQLIREEKGPVVVFSDHVQSSKDLQTIIAQGDGSKGSRFRVALIIGETPMGNRSATVDKFQRGELDCLVGSIGACSTGITLTRSNIVVFNDLSWVPSRNMQALGRIYRISQTRHCLSYTMVGGKMDKKIAEKLREKMKVIREIDE